MEEGLRGKSRPLRVCDVNDLFSPSGGGVRTFHERKLDYFRRRGDVHYTLVVPGEADECERTGSVVVQRIRSPRVPGLWNYRLLASPGKLAGVLRRARPDVVEVGGCYLTPWTVALAMRQFGALRTGFWHTDYPHAFAERPVARFSGRLAAVAKRIAWGYARLTYGRFAHVFVASDYAERCLREQGIGPTSKHPLGVDTDVFRPECRDEELRRSIGVDERTALCAFPHRLIEEKGLSMLLEAWPAISAQCSAKLVFFGTGPRLGRLRRWMRGRTDVEYLGYLSDVHEYARWLSSADVVFALSAYETFGLSAAEALACGVPLVGVDGGAIADHVRDSGCGVLVPRGDVEGLAKETLQFLEDAPSDLGLRGRAYAEANFSWKASFDGMLAETHRLIAEREAARGHGFTLAPL